MQPTTDPGPSTGLYFDREGQWHHDGDRIRHQRLADLLSRSVARAENDTLIVTTGRDRVAMAAEDAPVVVRTVRPTADGLILVYSHGQEQTLSSRDEILIDAAGQMRMVAPGNLFWARLLRPAAQALANLMQSRGETTVVETKNGATSVASAVTEIANARDWSARPVLKSAP